LFREITVKGKKHNLTSVAGFSGHNGDEGVLSKISGGEL
jgi:hypothetical protein